MPAKKLPETDDGRIKALQTIINQDELIGMERAILPIAEFYEYRNLLLSFEGSSFCFKQALEDEQKADKAYVGLFKTAQLYISHFIQVLNMAIIRNEIKTENLAFYGLENSNEFTVPDLSSENAVLEWGERLISGEANRTAKGGAPIYNPPISKVKVHYDLFKDSLHSLTIYRHNTIRAQENLEEMRNKIDRFIWDTWTKLEFKYWGLPAEERKKMFDLYGIQFHHQAGEQLNVFG
ncbi:MAG: hypothetical protein LBH12_03600 [Dysgonamonadaceae bacterium]|jgi:hypothetical protein|nr:hypothetical protein [Dysgonamonadaceae bacterium]